MKPHKGYEVLSCSRCRPHRGCNKKLYLHYWKSPGVVRFVTKKDWRHRPKFKI